MALLPYDVNAYIKTHSSITTLLTSLGVTGTLDIVPINSPEPCDTSGNPFRRPFLRYYWMPNILDLDQWFIRRDRVRYYVMDRDYDRMMQIAEVLVQIFNRETGTNPHKIACSDGKNRIFHSRITASNTLNPNEKDGLASMMLEFEFRFVTQLL